MYKWNRSVGIVFAKCETFGVCYKLFWFAIKVSAKVCTDSLSRVVSLSFCSSPHNFLVQNQLYTAFFFSNSSKIEYFALDYLPTFEYRIGL